MDARFVLFPFVVLVSTVSAQFTSQTYPDPRLDPFSCRLALPSQVCDPSAIVSDEERTRLVQRVSQLHSLTSGIKNTSPSCALMPDRNLEIIVAIIDKIGSVPGVPVDIEKFANNLKRRYQNFQVRLKNWLKISKLKKTEFWEKSFSNVFFKKFLKNQ